MHETALAAKRPIAFAGLQARSVRVVYCHGQRESTGASGRVGLVIRGQWMPELQAAGGEEPAVDAGLGVGVDRDMGTGFSQWSIQSQVGGLDGHVARGD